MSAARHVPPSGFHSVTPTITLANAAKGIDWYIRAFGATEVSRATGPDGKIIHAEIDIGDSRLMVNDAVMGYQAPRALGGSPVGFWIYVADADAVYGTALSEGAKPAPGRQGEMADRFWGDRTGTVIDPEGYMWTIAMRNEEISAEELKRREAAFFAQVSH